MEFRVVGTGTRHACVGRVGHPSTTYEPRGAADSVMYQVVRDHYETFVAQTASFRDGEGLPRFIDEEFRGLLRCGWLAGGFARFRCEGCHKDAALNVNVHTHALVLDGVFAEDATGALVFHLVSPPDDEALDAMLGTIARDRIRLTSEGDVLLELRHRWRDGTTHLRFHPLELLERLASLTPRPRINLVLYYGVVAAHAAWRRRLPSPGRAAAQPSATLPVPDTAAGAAPLTVPPVDAAVRPGSNRLWAQLMQRTFGFDVLQCPRCGGRLRLLAVIDAGPVARSILGHLGLPTDVPPARPARAPPVVVGTRAVTLDLDAP